MRTAALALALALAAATPLIAAPLPVDAPALLLPAGTPVPLALAEEISSRTHGQGDRVRLEVSEDVSADGRVLIPRGAPALAEIAQHRAKGGWGRAGLVELRLLHVEIGGQLVRLDGQRSVGGKSNAGPAIASGIIVAAVLGAIITGKHAVLPAGTRLTGYVHRDRVLRPGSALPTVPSP